MRIDIHFRNEDWGSAYWHPGDQTIRVEGPQAQSIRNLLWGMRDPDSDRTDAASPPLGFPRLLGHTAASLGSDMTEAELFYSLPQRLREQSLASLILNDDGTPLEDTLVAQGWLPSRLWPKKAGDPRPRDTDVDLSRRPGSPGHPPTGAG